MNSFVIVENQLSVEGVKTIFFPFKFITSANAFFQYAMIGFYMCILLRCCRLGKLLLYFNRKKIVSY